MDFNTLKNERSRTYHFPTTKVTLQNVVKLAVRPSGTHRIQTAKGRKFIIPPGWVSIEIDGPWEL